MNIMRFCNLEVPATRVITILIQRRSRMDRALMKFVGIVAMFILMFALMLKLLVLPLVVNVAESHVATCEYDEVLDQILRAQIVEKSRNIR